MAQIALKNIGMSRLWHGFSRALRFETPSIRRAFGARHLNPAVVAVGGHSFDGMERATAFNILNLILEQGRVVVVHGNGPQVGELLEQAEDANETRTVFSCTEQTQREMGAKLSEEILEVARLSLVQISSPVVIETRIEVDPSDMAFNYPTKYIGRKFPLNKFIDKAVARPDGLYEWEENGVIWIMKQVDGEPGIYRRVVPSPKPIRIHPDDLLLIQDAYFKGKIVIAAGGGGVPILPNGEKIEAVIDKDLSAALLCKELLARKLIISTGVKYVSHNFGQADQFDIRYLWARQAFEHLLEGQYPAGSMGEKIEAAINVLRAGTNEVLISNPLASWLSNEGTLITRGPDIASRLRRKPVELERWLVG